jgi:hypothetical protein
MSRDLASVEPDGPLYRLGRQPDPLAWPDWAYAGPDGTFGNRYDDPEASYRVLYASSQRIGTSLETLARFRPDLEVLAELEQIDGDDEPPPGVPRAWLETRMVGKATPGTIRRRRRRTLARHAPNSARRERDSLRARRDRRGDHRLRAPRAFTQQVSRFIYEQRENRGAFVGIRYRSRLGDEIVNWAVFEPAPDAPSPFFRATFSTIEGG